MGSGFTAAELRLLGWFVRVAEQVIPAGHPSRPHIAGMLDRLACTVSSERNSDQAGTRESNQHNTITTREAARLLGCTQRRIQQRCAAGELPAHRIGRAYFIDKDTLTE